MKSLEDFSEREMDFVVHAQGGSNKKKTIRLDGALTKALEW